MFTMGSKETWLSVTVATIDCLIGVPSCQMPSTGICSYIPESQLDNFPPVATEERFALDMFISAKIKKSPEILDMRRYD